MRASLILLWAFVLWAHFAPAIDAAYHHLFVSASSRWSASDNCELAPRVGFDWLSLRPTFYSEYVDSDCR